MSSFAVFAEFAASLVEPLLVPQFQFPLPEVIKSSDLASANFFLMPPLIPAVAQIHVPWQG